MRIGIDGDAGALSAEVRSRIQAGLAKALTVAERTARERAPRKTGRLRQGIRAVLAGGSLTGALVSLAPYSSHLHFGTGVYGPKGRPSTVAAKNKKALSRSGGRHPVKRVFLRGIEPRDFLREAVRESLLREAFEEGFEKKGRGSV